MEITDTVRARWGVVFDREGRNLTRPVTNPCGERKEECGVLEWIKQVEFDKLDRDENKVLDRNEYLKRFTVEDQVEGRTGFGQLYDFGKLSENHSTATGFILGVSQDTWDLRYEGARDIFLASIKDPLVRSFWTPCAVQTFGTPLPISGNVSDDPATATWAPKTSFDQLEDGRILREVTDLKDDDNNVYLFNVLVRHKVTGEQVAYKTHVVQRLTPEYKVPDVAGPEVGLIVGVSVVTVVIVAAIVLAIVLNRSKKMRPRLRVSKHVIKKKKGKE
uniref:EF-hand domain-containing protein n=1 Tax=Hemiselmis andersenii TaxID=464988 RepID=A0A7S0UEV3_HEMAN|mmetsp:Transcript_9911/g.23152  ORF Transcript_9911/g.23152 Transcript_9911/m.23152 type:complete len:275 (+) Transcript_9911:1-825(+)